MAEHGVDRRAAEAAAAKSDPVALNDALQREEPFGAYFKEEVRRQLVERFGWERVYEGGLKVYTTIDTDDPAGGRAARRARPSTEIERAPRLRASKTRQSPAAADATALQGASSPSIRVRRSARAGRRAELRGQPVQPRRAGAAAAGLGVQAVRLSPRRSRRDVRRPR